jgi:transposase-like protein
VADAVTTKRQQAQATARKATATKRRRKDPAVRAEHERQILALLVAGASIAEIARAVEVSTSLVYRVRLDALRHSTEARDLAAEQLRTQELDRLDRLQRAHWSRALDGHIESSKLVLKIIEQRAKMLGLYAAIRVDATVKSQLDAEIESLIDDLESKGLATVDDSNTRSS